MFDLGPSYVPLPPELADAKVRLRPPRFSDYRAWQALREHSRTFLEPWEPVWESDMLTRAAYRKRVRLTVRDWRDDRGYGFHIFTSRDMELVGGVNLTGVRRRAAQYASLGYWMGEAVSNKGLMSAALRLLLPAAFQEFGLHRVEAACIPENAPSRALLDKFGFRQVGLARQYLRINGSWRDHVLHELQIDDLMSSRGMLGDAAPRARLVDRRA
ncbi:MAG TPA: GNAT family protein [Dongiaceae bacterium]|nr:GNAT family protein [Dongiaceae bacterium]